MNGEPNMLYADFTGKLLGLQRLRITNIEENDGSFSYTQKWKETRIKQTIDKCHWIRQAI